MTYHFLIIDHCDIAYEIVLVIVHATVLHCIHRCERLRHVIQSKYAPIMQPCTISMDKHSITERGLCTFRESYKFTTKSGHISSMLLVHTRRYDNATSMTTSKKRTTDIYIYMYIYVYIQRARKNDLVVTRTGPTFWHYETMSQYFTVLWSFLNIFDTSLIQNGKENR